MKSKWGLAPILLFGLAIVLSGSNSQGALIYEDTFYLYIFTDNGIYADDSEVNLYVEVFRDDSDADLVYFEFHNDSTMYSSIANIYFDDGGSLLSAIDSVDEGPGTSFDGGGSPGNLPAGLCRGNLDQRGSRR